MRFVDLVSEMHAVSKNLGHPSCRPTMHAHCRGLTLILPTAACAFSISCEVGNHAILLFDETQAREM